MKITEELSRFRNALIENGIDTTRMEIALPATDAALLASDIRREVRHLIHYEVKEPCPRRHHSNVLAEFMGISIVAKPDAVEGKH